MDLSNLPELPETDLDDTRIIHSDEDSGAERGRSQSLPLGSPRESFPVLRRSSSMLGAITSPGAETVSGVSSDTLLGITVVETTGPQESSGGVQPRRSLRRSTKPDRYQP